jgi:hypothetical protein
VTCSSESELERKLSLTFSISDVIASICIDSSETDDVTDGSIVMGVVKPLAALRSLHAVDHILQQ